MNSDVEKLARLLQPAISDVSWGRGVVKSVNTGAKTAVITTTGGDVNMPYYSHLTLSVADVVDVLYAGSASRVLGVIS